MRLILRGLIKAPLFTTAAIVSLAFGIGANTAIFSLIDQMLLRTLPAQNPEELAYIYAPGPWDGGMSTDEGGGPSFSYPLMREMQREVLKPGSSFAGLAGSRDQASSLTYNNNSQLGRAKHVTGNYFPLLGVRPALGRLLTEDDDRTEGGHPVVVLSAHYWISRFGGDPGVLNQKLIVNGYPFTIVGVAQKDFGSERLGAPPDAYLPISMKKDTTPDWDGYADRRGAWVTMFVRRKPGVTLAQAEAEINLPYRAQVEQDIRLIKGDAKMVEGYRARKMMLKSGEHGRGGLRDDALKPLLMLIGITGMVLLIACANVANLQLARSAARTREVSIRLAIGASRRQLIRQLLAESCVLSVAGGALGLLVAYGTLKGILTVIPAGRGMTNFLSASLDPRLLVFAFALSVATGLVFGLFPALHASRPDLVTSLKEQAGQVSPSGSANLFRKILVTAQVAVALLLLISGGLFARTMVNLTHIDLGIKADNLMTFSVLPKLNKYTDQQTAAFHDQLLEKLSGIPGVTLASTALVPAIAGSNSSNGVKVPGYTPQGIGDGGSNFNAVGPGYFRTMGVPLIEGREFTQAETLASPKVVVVNEAFVHKFLKDRNALGQHITSDFGPAGDIDMEIVGVMKDSKYSNMREPAPTVYYVPMTQLKRWGQLNYYIRTSADPATIGPGIQRAVVAIDPNLPIRDLKTMQRQLDENLFQERIVSTLTAAFAGLATLLAAVGLYGVLAFNIARRTREIGIRIALGAAAGNVRGLVAREVLLMLLIGTVIGVSGAAAGGRLVQSLLFGMKPWDWPVYTAAVIAMWLVAFAAALVPTRRAMRVDPMVALRYE